MRVGNGYDVHKLVKGRPLILGGVSIPHEYGLLGHSDADVLSHAISDALLGALSLGNIGDFFPDTDPKYKGISSLILLKEVRQEIDRHGYKIENIDSVLVAQRPKLQSYISSMRSSLAQTLTIDTNKISVKATTTEALGFEGREEGISCHAVVLLNSPK